MGPRLLGSHLGISGQPSYTLEIDRTVATFEVDQTLEVAMVLVPLVQQLFAELLDISEGAVGDSRLSQLLGNPLAVRQVSLRPGGGFSEIALDTLHGVSQSAATHVHFAVESRSLVRPGGSLGAGQIARESFPLICVAAAALVGICLDRYRPTVGQYGREGANLSRSLVCELARIAAAR